MDEYTKILDSHIARVADVKPVTEDVVSTCVRMLKEWYKTAFYCTTFLYKIVFSSQMATVDGDSEEDTIHCATCGMQISLKKAMVHMEKCFMKVAYFWLV